MNKKINKKGYSPKENKIALFWAKKIILVKEKGGKCEKCNIDDLFVLEFHHFVGGKEDDIGEILHNGSLDDARLEAKKCIILCRNCHQQIHGSDNDTKGNIKKTIMLESMGIDSCQLCGYRGENNACLDFHHIDPSLKTFSFSAYFNKPCSIDGDLIDSREKVLAEVRRCKVVCRNCHALIHLDSERFNRLKEYIYHKVNTYVGKKEVNGELIKTMHNDGMYAAEIGRKLNLSRSTVHHFLTRNNLLKFKGDPGLVTMWKNRKSDNDKNNNNT